MYFCGIFFRFYSIIQQNYSKVLCESSFKMIENMLLCYKRYAKRTQHTGVFFLKMHKKRFMSEIYVDIPTAMGRKRPSSFYM